MAENLESNESLSSQIKKSIIEKNLDTGLDYAELGLDSFIADGVLKEIPIVKTIMGFAGTGLKIKEAFFAKKILTFLSTFHAGKLSDEKMVDFRIRMEDDQKYREEVLEIVMVYIDRFMEVKQAEIFANLFQAHLNGRIEWDFLRTLLFSLQQLNVGALPELVKISEQAAKSANTRGFVIEMHAPNTYISALVAAGLGQQVGNYVKGNRAAFFLYRYGILADINYELTVDQAKNMN
ncbi:hypothetical protein [Filimonas effusa]|uniref:Uncharacterized protein n=1 Tax=Filimonas effusa TaxID=2508721 RepID=A0A4Q1D2I6_9BACT|nr:hypothetical protein [Filimonas effusa]RXK81275.1 hypothetical protein ESB13_20275 [Filimonas effusa]